MVSANSSREEAIGALRAWSEGLPAGVATKTESESELELIFRVVPQNPASAALTIHLSNYGTFDVYLGSSIRVEDIPLSVVRLLEICDAVRHGRFQEEVWKQRGVLLKAVGELRLASGDLHGTDFQGALGSLGADQHLLLQYEPYELG